MIPFNKQVPIKVLSMVKHIAILDTQTVVLGVCVYHTVVLGREPGTSLCRKVVLGHVPRTGLHGIVITEHLGTELNLFCSFPQRDMEILDTHTAALESHCRNKSPSGSHTEAMIGDFLMDFL